MLKENDLASTAEEGDEGAVRVRKVLSDVQTESIGAFVTVEVRSLDEALAAAEAWAERMLEHEEGVRLNILLDNMGPELSRDAVLDIEPVDCDSMSPLRPAATLHSMIWNHGATLWSMSSRLPHCIGQPLPWISPASLRACEPWAKSQNHIPDLLP